MFDIDTWQEILHTMRANKLRTFLTAFSVAWGIFMLILLLGFGNGLQNGVVYQFRDDAINSIWVRPGQTSIPYKGMKPGRHIQFTNDDFDMIMNSVAGIDHITARYYVFGEFTVRYKDKYSAFRVRACHPDHQYLENTILVKGRFLNDYDIEQRRKVAVIGTKIVEILFGENDPIGEWIDVNGILYKVVGIYRDEGSEHEVRIIYIPISTAQMAYGGSNRVHHIMFTTGDASLEESREMEKEVSQILSTNHRYSPNDPRAVRINNNAEHFQKFMDLFDGINLFLWVVGLGTIIAGIVSVSNIMLIAVKERTREIGIRKAIGATPQSIVSMFLQESVLITVLAGYSGLILGIGLIELIHWTLITFNLEAEFFRNPEIDIKTAVLATCILIVSGVVAGYFPARRAARIMPVEVLHDE